MAAMAERKLDALKQELAGKLAQLQPAQSDRFKQMKAWWEAGGRELAGAVEQSALERVRLLDCLAGQGVELEGLLYQRERLTFAHPWRVLECEPSLKQSSNGG